MQDLVPMTRQQGKGEKRREGKKIKTHKEDVIYDMKQKVTNVGVQD